MNVFSQNLTALDELRVLYQKVLLLGEKLTLCERVDVRDLTNERHRLLNRVTEQTSFCRSLLHKLEEQVKNPSQIAQINERKEQIFDFAPQLHHQNKRIEYRLKSSLKETRQEMMGFNQKQRAVKAYAQYNRTLYV